MSKINERVVVLSVDQWLNMLHGASILRLFKALTKLGYRVKVYVPSDKKIIMEDGFLSVMTLEVKRYVPLVTLISLYRRALKLIFEEKSSVLIFDPIFFPLFLLNGILRKSKGFMLILNRPLPQKNFLGLVSALYFRLLLMLAKAFVNAFTASTPFEAAEFARIGKIPKHKITVIPSPLGEEFQKFSFPIDENEVRLKLGWNALSGKKVLLYQGVLAEIRGVLKILELFIQSFKGDDKTILLVVGDGPAKDSVKNFISRNKANNIILSDPVPYSKMPEVVAACDVGLVLFPDNPYWGNQCPTKLIEFLALGKPVIASDLPGIRWIAGNSPLVFYMKKMTVSSYKEALRKLFIKKQGIITDSPRVRQEMIERFSSYSVALKLSKMISSV